MRVAITGASGLIGNRLSSFLSENGHEVLALVRRNARSTDEVSWDPAGGHIDVDRLEGIDAVVHLAGENIAGGRWTTARKAAIRDSRVHGTRTLCDGLRRLDRRPRVLVSASAIGFYGDRGDEALTEESASGDGFLADVCRRWEDAAAPASAAGIRVVTLRIGVVLTSEGGALKTMLPPFRLGIGGVLGAGDQYMSWIAIEDLVRAIYHCIDNEALRGPVNAVAPSPVTNQELTRALGRVLHRPTFLPVPAFALRLLVGEMADALLLASTRVEPVRLRAAGFEFLHPRLEEALSAELAR